MNAVLDAPPPGQEAQQQPVVKRGPGRPPGSGRRNPSSGDSNQSRVRKKAADAAAEVAANPNSLTTNWKYYREVVMNDRGKIREESRKAYFNGAMDTLTLIAKTLEGVPPGFMDWIQECQRGMLARD